MSDPSTEVADANCAVCPACRCNNPMPLECLRERWQPMDCGRCEAPLEYRGRHLADGDHEVRCRMAGLNRTYLGASE